MKNIKGSVYDAVASYYNNSFAGGKNLILDAKVNGIGLPMDTSRFKKFTKENYDKIYNELIEGKIKILKDTDIDSPDKLPLNIVKINYVK